MIRNIAALAIALFAVVPAAAQEGGPTFIWNGPLTGTTNWSLGNWTPSTPTAGGSPGTRLIFNQIGVGAYTAANDLGNPYVLSFLDLMSGGGGITVNNVAGNTLGFTAGSVISQNGIGVAVISSTATLTSGFTMFAGNNLGNVQVNGSLSGAGSVNINRTQNQSYTGFVDLTVANTYGGGTDLQAGNLRVGNATALGAGTLRVTGGTLGATTALTIANPVSVNSTNFVYSGFASLTMTGVISQIGTAGVTVSSNTTNTLTLQGTNTYTGPTSSIVNPRSSTNGPSIGSLTFSGPNGSAALSSDFTFTGGSNLTLANAAVGANNNNRIGDNAPLFMSGGSFLITGANGGATLENIGPLFAIGSFIVTADASTAGNTGTTLQSDSLTRSVRSQFVFRGSNLGAALGANVGNLIFDAPPALTNGIIPYAVGTTTTAGNGTDLVTYGANGVRPLALGEYTATITSGASNLNNTRITGANAITAPSQINALVVATGGAFSGSTSTLTLASGTMLNTAAITVPATMTLNFGAAEGNLFNNATMTVDGVLTGTNGLTKTGTSNLALNNIANNVTGALTINAGAVVFTDPAAIGSFGSIVVSGHSSGTTPPALSLTGAANANVNKPMSVTDGFARLQSGTGTMTYSGQITGAGGILVTAGNVELTNVSNNYTGQTRVFGGNILVSSDAVLGAGGGVDIGSNTTTGLRLTGNWTTSRQINISFTSQIDTNGFNWTINSPLTGTSASTTTLTKVGAGIWTLSQGGALGQNLATGSQPTNATVNVSAGELRATNPTGSATGTATVNINNASIISGNGNFGGATTIAVAAFVQPGLGGTNVDTLRFGGTLVINGTYTVDGATTIADRINVLGAVTLSGTSVLNLTGTYDAGTVFTLMTFPSLTGTFGTVNGLPATHTLVYNPTSIQLVPEPVAILAVAGLGLAGGYAIRKRRQWRRVD